MDIPKRHRVSMTSYTTTSQSLSQEDTISFTHKMMHIPTYLVCNHVMTNNVILNGEPMKCYAKAKFITNDGKLCCAVHVPINVHVSDVHRSNNVCALPLCKHPYTSTCENGGTKTLDCKHVFHTSCITQWLAMDQACPVCRKVIPMTYKECVEMLKLYFDDTKCNFKTKKVIHHAMTILLMGIMQNGANKVQMQNYLVTAKTMNYSVQEVMNTLTEISMNI